MINILIFYKIFKNLYDVDIIYEELIITCYLNFENIKIIYF